MDFKFEIDEIITTINPPEEERENFLGPWVAGMENFAERDAVIIDKIEGSNGNYYDIELLDTHVTLYWDEKFMTEASSITKLNYEMLI